MAGIVRRAPEGSMIVSLTMLSKTEGGPSVAEVETTGAAAAESNRRAADGSVDRATRKIEDDIMVIERVRGSSREGLVGRSVASFFQGAAGRRKTWDVTEERVGWQVAPLQTFPPQFVGSSICFVLMCLSEEKDASNNRTSG